MVGVVVRVPPSPFVARECSIAFNALLDGLFLGYHDGRT